MEVTLNTAKIANIGYILSWDAQVSYPKDFFTSEFLLYKWFSPIGWQNA